MERKDPITTLSKPLSARQQNGIKMAFRWQADDGQTLNAGLVALWFSRAIRTSIAKESYSFAIFQG